MSIYHTVYSSDDKCWHLTTSAGTIVYRCGSPSQAVALMMNMKAEPEEYDRAIATRRLWERDCRRFALQRLKQQREQQQ